jgi:hypothetical protein
VVTRRETVFAERITEPETPQQKNVLSPNVVLAELFVLLEDYAPAWYTEEHHRRAIAALLARGQTDSRPEIAGH